MKLRTRFWGVVGSLGLMASGAWGGEPRQLDFGRSAANSRTVSVNQRIAQEIGVAIARQVPERGYAVELEFQAGVATLRGVAASADQMAEIVRAAERTPSVERVVNQVRLRGSEPVQTASLRGTRQDEVTPAPMPRGTVMNGQTAAGAPATLDPSSQQPMSAPAPQHVFAGVAGQDESPFLPPFAWPQNAPYPNYSAVQYPTCYPAQAYPFIGPFHPYPEPPLDWRKVTLKWDDGHWYLKFYQTCHSHPYYNR